jgi:DNA-directed RNA polymerase subunit RPC12/RpoP
MRRGTKDFTIGLLGARPWRCRTCGHRFYAWAVPADFVFYAHCQRCGNLDLQRLARERVADGVILAAARLLRLKGYRCDRCRTRFFSWRLYRPIVPTRVEPPKAAPAEGSATGSAHSA